jgi:hypothetical protein
MNNPSTEQSLVISSIEKGQNTQIEAVAGSGKTTTILSVASAFPKHSILQVTYNKSLKDEVRRKVEEYRLKNTTIHTYHSLARTYFDISGYDDNMIETILTDSLHPRQILTFTIICIDETQDQTKLYFDFMKYLCSFIANPYQMMILGDRYQSIYQFKGTDARFLTFAGKIWNRPFTELSLSTSYRLTNQISSFINNDILHHHRMNTVKDGPPVHYIRCDPFHESHSNVIIELILLYKHKPEDIFILSPSLKSRHTKLIENALVKRGILCYYPISDDASLDEDVMRGKVVFSTFHQSKGRERKCVVVYHFDMSYFTFYARDSDTSYCSNAMYVALTRSSETLIVVESFQSEPFSFLPPLDDLKKLSYLSVKEVFYDGRANKDKQPEKSKKEQKTVTELLKYIKNNEIFAMTESLFTIIKSLKPPVAIPDRIKIGDIVESVAEINGLVIPCIYESETTGFCSIISYVEERLGKSIDFIKKYCKKNIEKKSSIQQYIYYTLVYLSMQNSLLNQLEQITDVTWLNDDMIDECHHVLRKELNDTANYEDEIYLEYTGFPEYGTIQLSGRVDARTYDTLYEIKCVDTVSSEHLLQLIVYAWMYKEKGFYYEKYKLINIKSGDIYVLNYISNESIIEDIMLLLFRDKFGECKQMTNKEFLESFTV